MYGNECISPPSPSTTSPASYLVASQVKAAMKNMSTLYQHLRSELVPPRVKTMAAAWQLWDSVQDGVGDTIHIDYDGEYGSERVLIVSGRATVVPDDGSPSFTVRPGDVVYFMRGFRCTWRIHESPNASRQLLCA